MPVADNDTPALAAPQQATPPAEFDIEQPACFYLGREYDLARKSVVSDSHLMYDARDLTTHGVIVGMTGSGKTGLAISILEEAAIDGIPCIIIDPKGDLTNLLLQFPDLSPQKLRDWVNEDDARIKKLSPEKYAEQLAARWRQGLAETGQKPERIQTLMQSAEWRIYTPGSESGLPVSILGSFAGPGGGRDLSAEDVTRKIDAVTTALLGLAGIESDPVQSREHVLIARLLMHAWEKERRDLDLHRLILEIQNPPFDRVGAYSLETFFPARDRVKFASSLNNVLAAPSFANWIKGEPLDLSSMVYRAGKPQHVIFYIAHLDDVQRMFFTTLLLEEVLSWTRRQTGTTNLRAILYFDELFGYLPPHPANPPSKGPLLTLLKQARAFGVGVLLATQNPVDIDYKALSNAGTWFVGKLQTERDKLRLLDGLESAAAEHGTLTDRGYLDKVISSLSNRVFLLHDIHRSAPTLFQTRWALSFLRGPITREQVGKLMAPFKQQMAAPGRTGTTAGPAVPQAIPLCSNCFAELGPNVGEVCPSCGKRPWANAQFRLQDQAFRANLARAATPAAADASSARHQQPVLPPDVRQFYLPVTQPGPGGAEIEYQPGVLGFGEVVFVVDKRKGKEHRTVVRCLAKPAAPGHPIDWSAALAVGDKLDAAPRPDAGWAGVPDSLDTGRKLKALEKTFADFLYSTQKLSLFENRPLGLVSEPGEPEDAFRARCRTAAQAQAMQALEMEKVKFRPKFEALGLDLPADPKSKSGSWWDWLTSSNSKQPSGPPASRQEEKERKLQADYQAKQNEIREKWRRVGEEATRIEVKPRKADVQVTHFGLAWMPCWRLPTAGQVQMLPAYR